jgi:hypothetical protein
VYRDGTTAEIEVLRSQASRAAAAQQALRAEREALRAELRRIKEGIEHDPALEADVPYRRMRVALATCGALAACLLAAGVSRIAAWAVADPMWSMQGLRNFAWHVAHGRGLQGIAATGFVLLLAVPWVALPLLGRRGMRRERRWGWLASVAGAVLFLPTPLAPLAIYALAVLCSRRVQKVYFPGG